MDEQDRKIMLTTIARIYNGLMDMGAHDQAKWLGLAHDELCQAKKEKHCKWRYHQEASWKYECPECHCFYPGEWNYCANCGAKMDGQIEGQTTLVEEAKKAIRTGGRWRPFVKLEPSAEIKAVHPDWCYVMEDPPDDEQEILVSNGKAVWADTFYNDGYGCRLDSDHELDGCAWMPMPDPVWEAGDE